MSVLDTVCNMALSHLSSSHLIVNYKTERSVEARQCRTFLPFVIKDLLETCQWSSASRIKKLTLQEENPTSAWKFSYLYPPECALITALKRANTDLWSRIDKLNGVTDIEFKVMSGGSHKLIYTNQPLAEIEFVEYTEDLDKFPSSFIFAASFRLASFIAPPLTKGDASGAVSRMLSLYRTEVTAAQNRNFNEQTHKETDDRSTLELARGGH